MNCWFAPLSLCKKCPHAQWTMPMSQYDKHTGHCVLGSVLSNSHNSMFPTSRIICFDSGLKGLNDSVVPLVEEHVDLGGSQFSDSVLERWYSAHASQQNVVALESRSPCPPRSPLFAHDSNCHDQYRVSPFFPELFGLQRWILCFHEKNVFENYLAHFLCLCQ